MKPFVKFIIFLVIAMIFLFSHTVWADVIWSGDVHAGGVIQHSMDTPLETVQVAAGDMLTILADPGDEWQLFTEGTPGFSWINADGFFGFEYEGIPVGALAGRIGANGDWFFIGTQFSTELSESGMLQLACWDYPEMTGDNADSIHVTVDRKEFNPADLDQDEDVDGKDLYLFLQDMSVPPLTDMAEAFGWVEITTNADLASLSVSSGSLSPQFSRDRSNYLLIVDNSVDEILIEAVASDPLARVEINGVEVSADTGHAVSLNTGNTYVDIRVTSRDNTVEKTYSLLVNRETGAALSNLGVTGYALSPAFVPETRVYMVYADPSAQIIELTPETDDPADLIYVNGDPVDSGSAVQLPLFTGMTEIEIRVTAGDGSERFYFVYVRQKPVVNHTVFVVDEKSSADEFETLTGAVEYLNLVLLSGQVGEIQVQTTAPMQVDALTLTGHILISVNPGASNVIEGPSATPLIINALAGAGISGLSFANSPGYAIYSDTGLNVSGSSFSSDTLVNLSGSVSSAASKGSAGSYSKNFNFVGNVFSGNLDLTLNGDADTDFTTVGNNAAGLRFQANGSITGDAWLMFKANPVAELNIMAKLTGNTQARVMAHGGVIFSSFGFELDENAVFTAQQHTTAELQASFKGLSGSMKFDTVTAVDALFKADMKNSEYSGTGNSFTRASYNLSYTHGDSIFGINEKGGYVYQTLSVNGPEAPTNAEFTLGLEGMDIAGNLNMVVGGKVKTILDNGTIIRLDAYLKLPGSYTDINLDRIHCYAKFLVEFPESGVQLFLNAQYADIDQGVIIDIIDPASVTGTLDRITTITGGISMGHDLLSVPGPDEKTISIGAAQEGGALVLKNLKIKDSSDKPGLYIEGIDTPVTIQDSTIDAQIWSIVCADIDAAVTIKDNPDLKGGIMLDGDPGAAGVMIDQPYLVSGNTIAQNMAGGSCLNSHSVRTVQVSNNTMNPVSGAHGILLSGGKMTVDGGSINGMGPFSSVALGAGPSHGGANGILYAGNIDPISGSVNPSDQGYIKLTGNTFSNSVVFDVDAGRLLNNPVENNSGLDPDEDIIGCLIDWNVDEHNCPDYPTDCDEWDQDRMECGCGQDGINPPSEPGI